MKKKCEVKVVCDFTGPDEIHSEILQLLSEDSLPKLVKLFDEIYSTGELPEEWLKSTLITLPKKASASKCDMYRIIKLNEPFSKSVYENNTCQSQRRMREKSG